MKGHFRQCTAAMIYGAEKWPIKKENILEVAGKRMLSWSCGIKRLDRIRNDVIRNKIKVTNGKR